MIDRASLNDFIKRQKQIRKLTHEFKNDFRQSRIELIKKAMEVLRWKDDNLGQEFLRYKRAASLHGLRNNCLVLICYDSDPEIPKCYYNVSYDEIFSDDWKEPVLKEYKERLREREEQVRIAEERAAAEQEAREHAEYERLKAKFENA